MVDPCTPPACLLEVRLRKCPLARYLTGKIRRCPAFVTR